MKTKIPAFGIAAVLCILSFLLGRLSISHRVVLYSVEGNPKAFPRDRPTYGLPLAEYVVVLSEFKGTNSQKALSDLETFLDTSVQSAIHRRPLLTGGSLEQLDKSLTRVAQYRQKYPRPLSEGTGFYWTADKQAQIDSFLKGFNN